MWWWLAASGLVLGFIGFLQLLAASWLAGRALLVAGRHLVSVEPALDRVFGPILEQPMIARGAAGWLSIAPFLYCFLALVCAPVVGNSAMLVVEHGLGYGASWAEVYPDPGRWILGAVLFAGLVHAASLSLTVELHLRGWGLRLAEARGRLLAFTGRLLALAVCGFAGWVYGRITGVDWVVGAVAMTAGALALAWAANRVVWAAYGHLGLDVRQPVVRWIRVFVAWRLGSVWIARALAWSSLLVAVALGAMMVAFEVQMFGFGPELAALTPLVPLVATVVKDVVADVGRAAAGRHGLAFPEP